MITIQAVTVYERERERERERESEREREKREERRGWGERNYKLSYIQNVAFIYPLCTF